MKILLITLLIIQSLTPCIPENIILSYKDDYGYMKSMGISYGNNKPRLHITFISKTKCGENIQISAKQGGIKLNHYKNKSLLLREIYIAKIFDPKWKKSKYYKRYSYGSYDIEIEFLKHNLSLSYEIFDNIDPKNPVILKSFEILSQLQMEDNLKNFKVLTYGDQPMNEKDIEGWIVRVLAEKPDLIILLGDYAYEMFDNFGQKGDDFFNLIEPITATIPMLITQGNHDVVDDFKLLNYRFLGTKNYYFFQNNFYFFELPKVRFYLVNFDKYKTLSLENKIRAQKWLEKSIKDSDQKDKPKFKILISHRPFRCIGKDNQENCHDISYKTFFKGIEEIIAKSNFDLHLAGHIHQYQRSKMSLFQTENNLLNYFWDCPEFHMTTVVTGSAGKEEDYMIFKGKVGKKIGNDSAFILDKAYGYTILDFKYPLNEINGVFVDIGKNRRKILDEWTVEYRDTEDFEDGENDELKDVNLWNNNF